MSKELCETLGCSNFAEFIDEMDSVVCADCMERCVSDGDATYGDFETLHA